MPLTQMKSNIWKLFLTIVILQNNILLLCNAEPIIIKWDMQEENSPNIIIGGLKREIPVFLGNDITFISTNEFFKVNQRTGDVRAAQTIDLEELCTKHEKCCGITDCILPADILVMNEGTVVASVELQVHITDINDNKPIFASKNQKISVAENAKIGSFIGIDPAVDTDFDGVNRIEKYRISEPTGTFTIDQTSLPNIRLVVQKPLDREIQSEYPATLEACDKGACERQTLTIKILDINDNKPRFASRHYTKKLREDTKIGSYVLELKATDQDEGDNGKVLYTFNGNVDKNLADTFEVERDTGKIRLKKALAANIRTEYSFNVKACDAMDVSCSGDDESIAKVVIEVEDINNFPPAIEILPTQSYDENQGGDDLVIVENSPPSQLASIMVKDSDLNENGRVDCHIDDGAKNNGFQLSRNVAEIFSLRTDSIYDHEKQARISVLLTCSDNGKPKPLSTKRILKVKIKDVNEFLPQFSQNQYKARVKENSPRDTSVVTVSASDRDGESVITYFIVNSTYNSDRKSITSYNMNPEKAFFKINERTGLISTTENPIDREEITRVELTIKVTDAIIEPIHTVMTTVAIEIEDVNDNPPIFIRPEPTTDKRQQPTSTIGNGNFDLSRLNHPNDEDKTLYLFYINENLPPNSPVIGNIIAEDKDQGSNGEIEFSINSTWGLKIQSGYSDFAAFTQIMDKPVFRLNKDNLETLQTLDREEIPIYQLEVIARDRGDPQLSSVTMLIINVLDDNDNSPIWRFPTHEDRHLNISSGLMIGDLVIRLQAYDEDSLGSSKLDYLVLDSRGEPLNPISRSEGIPELYANNHPDGQGFSKAHSSGVDISGYRYGPLYLNGSTGEIQVAEALSVGTINLHLRAQDRGRPKRKHTDAWLNIHVYQDPNAAFGFFSWGTLNITIVLVMISVTALISLLLIGAIVCVQKRPRNHNNPDGLTINNGNDLHCNGTYLDKGIFANGYNWTQTTTGPNDYCYNGGLAGTPLLDENGQLIMGYGNNQNGGTISPNGMASDTTSMIFMPNNGNNPYSSTNGPSIPLASQTGHLTQANQNLISKYDNEYSQHQAMTPFQSFGTISRNPSRNQKPIMGLEGGLDGDSGDSGKGPSEEGNQHHLPNGHSQNNIYGSSSFRSANQSLLEAAGQNSSYIIPNMRNLYSQNEHVGQMSHLMQQYEIESPYNHLNHPQSVGHLTEPQDSFGQIYRAGTPKGVYSSFNQNSPGLPLPPPRSPRVGSTMTIRRNAGNLSSQLHGQQSECGNNYETNSLPRSNSRRGSLNSISRSFKPAQTNSQIYNQAQPPLKLDLRHDSKRLNQSRTSLDNQGLPPTGKPNQGSNKSNGSGEYESSANFQEETK